MKRVSVCFVFDTFIDHDIISENLSTFISLFLFLFYANAMYTYTTYTAYIHASLEINKEMFKNFNSISVDQLTTWKHNPPPLTTRTLLVYIYICVMGIQNDPSLSLVHFFILSSLA